MFSLEDGTFAGCTSLEWIDLVEGIHEFGDKVFYNCSSLKEIQIPSTVEKIGDGAFYGCKKIKELVFPASLKYIGNGALVSMTSLREIVCLGSVPPETPQKPSRKIATGAISVPSWQDKVKLYVPEDGAEAYAAHPFWGNFEIECLLDDID